MCGHVTLLPHVTEPPHVTPSEYDFSSFTGLFDSDPPTDKTLSSPVIHDFSDWLDFSSCVESAPKSQFKVSKPKPIKPQQIKLEKNLNHVISAKPQASPIAAFFSELRAGWDDKKVAASVVVGKIFKSYGDTHNVQPLEVNVDVNVNKASSQEPLNTSYMPYSPSQWGFVSSEFRKLWDELEDCVN